MSTRVRLVALCVLVAAAGIFGAMRLLKPAALVPAAQAAPETGLGRLLWKKWYVDELYDAAIVRPLTWLSREILWKRIDQGFHAERRTPARDREGNASVDDRVDSRPCSRRQDLVWREQGAIDVGHDENSGRIETPEHVCGKLLAAAEHLPPEQIMAAPDCGLVKLDVPTARAKLQAMAAGARMARERI